MNNGSETHTGELTLAFSLSAIERLEDPKAVFEDAQTWSQSIGLIDEDTERIEQVVAEYDLRQDFDMHDRDLWFALEDIATTTSTSRNVYVGASDHEMRVSTLFDWEYVRITEAAAKAGWTLSPRTDPGVGSRLFAFVRNALE